MSRWRYSPLQSTHSSRRQNADSPLEYSRTLQKNRDKTKPHSVFMSARKGKQHFHGGISNERNYDDSEPVTVSENVGSPRKLNNPDILVQSTFRAANIHIRCRFDPQWHNYCPIPATINAADPQADGGLSTALNIPRKINRDKGIHQSLSAAYRKRNLQWVQANPRISRVGLKARLVPNHCVCVGSRRIPGS